MERLTHVEVEEAAQERLTGRHRDESRASVGGGTRTGIGARTFEKGAPTTAGRAESGHQDREAAHLRQAAGSQAREG